MLPDPSLRGAWSCSPAVGTRAAIAPGPEDDDYPPVGQSAGGLDDGLDPFRGVGVVDHHRHRLVGNHFEAAGD